MREKAKALLRKNQNELPAVRNLEVSLDRADNVIEGGPAFRRRLGFDWPLRVPVPSRVSKGRGFAPRSYEVEEPEKTRPSKT